MADAYPRVPYSELAPYDLRLPEIMTFPLQRALILHLGTGIQALFAVLGEEPDGGYDSLQQALVAAGVGLSRVRSAQDLYGIYTVVSYYRRGGGTLARRSTLSGGTAPFYTTRTDEFYANDGTTVERTDVSTLTYADGSWVSETLA